MKNLIWRLRNATAKARYVAETFGMKALGATLARNLKEKARAAPLSPQGRDDFALFPVPRGQPRLTLILEEFDTATPEAQIGEAIEFCRKSGRHLRIVTRAAPARTDVFCGLVRRAYPDFRANVDFAFVDRANPYAELPVGEGDLFWPNKESENVIPARLILDRRVHVLL